MAHTRYSNYYNKEEKETQESVESAELENTNDATVDPAETTEPENIEEPEAPIVLLSGVVSDCDKLRIRKESSANSEILCLVARGTDLLVDPAFIHGADGSDDWRHVYTINGVEGYCMSKFVTIKDE